MTYAEKLKDPRWQRKRLEVLERDEFMCQHCFDDESELHVHHLEYRKNPWETDTAKLITLCKGCHEIVEALKKQLGLVISFEPHLQAVSDLLQILTRKDFTIHTILRGIVLDQSIVSDMERIARVPIKKYVASLK